MELKVFIRQMAAPFNDTEIYRMYVYRFYRQFPNFQVFLGIIVLAQLVIPGRFFPPTQPGYKANMSASVYSAVMKASTGCPGSCFRLLNLKLHFDVSQNGLQI